MIVDTHHEKVHTIEDYLLRKARDPEWVADQGGHWGWSEDGQFLSVTVVRNYVVITDRGFYEGVAKCATPEEAREIYDTFGVADKHDIWVNAYDRIVWHGDGHKVLDVPKIYDHDGKWLKLAAKVIEDHCKATGCYLTAWVSFNRAGTPVGYLNPDGSVMDLKVLS